MSDKNFLTKEWHKKLLEELRVLRWEKLPEVLQRLKDAIWQWDISENAEYETAMSEKDLVEARISELEELLNDVEIIDETDAKKLKWDIRYWSVVVFRDDKWKDFQFTIVGSWEVDILNWTLSFDSPLWVAIKWKKKWDIVSVRSPKWKYNIEILDIK